MSENVFWQGQAELDILYMVVFLGWGLSLILVLLLPGLTLVALESYRYKRTDVIGLYIGRFLPYSLFDTLVSLTRALFITSTLLSYLRGEPWWATHGGVERLLLYHLLGVLVLMFLDLLRRGSYALWAYTFMPPLAARHLDADRLMISYATLPLLLMLPLAAMQATLSLPALIALISVLGLGSLLRIVQVFRRLVGSSDGYVYVFLYLCTHELLPWAVVALIVRFASQGVLG